MKNVRIFIYFIFCVFLIRILYLNIYKNNYYNTLLNKKVNNIVYGSSAPRGRILDRNGKILVDNIGIKTLFYSKVHGISVNDEIEIAKKLASILDFEFSSNKDVLKENWLLFNNNGDDLITDEERELLKKRKLTANDIKIMKYERITEDMVGSLTDLDKEAAFIYNKMNSGYSFNKKMLYKNIDSEEYSKIVLESVPGISIEMIWERVYPYGDILKDIFGTIGSIQEENLDKYLNNGYEVSDIVGISYLEYQYENYLKGEKAIYELSKSNTLKLIKEEKRGNDLVLSIDIEVQKKLESIIKEQILIAKNYLYTDYFSETYSIVGDPNTGEIIAMSGQKLVDLNEKIFKNVNTNLINTSYTVGSIVKMATLSTGYKYGVVDIGTKMRDACVKLYQVPIKCSYQDLGFVDDLKAISKSSNYYQFKIALGLTDNIYKYNMKLDTTKEHFDKFRNVFKEYGLGSLTDIDLPNETIGIIGGNTSSDLFLNLSIGQYDTYTPVELFQYINTVASLGKKRKPSLMKNIVFEDKIIKENNYQIVSKVNLETKYLERLKEAMNEATKTGTARNYINNIYNPAGKTGTSETFIDTDNDKIMDTKTISLGFVGFAPFDNPSYSIVVLSPNLYAPKTEKYSKYYITRQISSRITNFLFEN